MRGVCAQSPTTLKRCLSRIPLSSLDLLAVKRLVVTWKVWLREEAHAVSGSAIDRYILRLLHNSCMVDREASGSVLVNLFNACIWLYISRCSVNCEGSNSRAMQHQTVPAHVRITRHRRLAYEQACLTAARGAYERATQSECGVLRRVHRS